jgi:hypothetical protein
MMARERSRSAAVPSRDRGRIKMGRTDHLAKLLGETAVEVWTDIPRARIVGKWLRKDEDAWQPPF